MIEREYSSARLGHRRAGYSSCDETYRYYLIIKWDMSKPYLTCCGLNPSTATERDDDRTIAKMVRLAKRWGYGALVMVNLFAYRATKPQVMLAADDPVGLENSPHFMYGICESDFLCAWGKHGGHMDRAATVKSTLRDLGLKLFYLRLNNDGSPAHPLYIPETGLEMQEWLK